MKNPETPEKDLETAQIIALMRQLTDELIRRDKKRKIHLFIVDGVYAEESQITGDFVVAAEHDDAFVQVQEIRAVAPDDWTGEVSEVLLNLKLLLEALAQSPAEIDAGLEQTLKELNGVRCTDCGTPYNEFNVDAHGLCEDCAERREDKTLDLKIRTGAERLHRGLPPFHNSPKER